MVFREKKQIVMYVLTFAVVAGFILFRYLPMQKKKEIITNAIAEQRLLMQSSCIERDKLPVLREKLLSVGHEVESYYLSIPVERELGEFLHKVAFLMDEKNLKNQSVQPDKEIVSGGLNCIPVNMKCQGGLKQIFEFYKSLQSLDRAVRIENIKLVNNLSFSGMVEMETKTIIYYQAEKKPGQKI